MINSIAVDGSEIFAGTDQGVFVSEDDGVSRLNITPVLPYPITSYSALSIVADAGDVFAGIEGNVYMSSDDGTTRQKMKTNFTFEYGGVTDMTVSGTKLIAWSSILKPAFSIHRLWFNADKLASGVYFYRLDAGSFSRTDKMVLLK